MALHLRQRLAPGSHPALAPCAELSIERRRV